VTFIELLIWSPSRLTMPPISGGVGRAFSLSIVVHALMSVIGGMTFWIDRSAA